jgi:hypothetical protein
MFIPGMSACLIRSAFWWHKQGIKTAKLSPVVKYKQLLRDSAKQACCIFLFQEFLGCEV